MTDPNKKKQKEQEKSYKKQEMSKNQNKFTDEERKQREALKYHTRGGFE